MGWGYDDCNQIHTTKKDSQRRVLGNNWKGEGRNSLWEATFDIAKIDISWNCRLDVGGLAVAGY